MTNPTDDPKDAWIATQVLALIDAGRASGLAPTELEARCIIAAALGEFTDEALQRKAMNRRTAYLAAVLIAKTYALFDPQYTNGAVYGVQVIDTRTGLQVEAPDTMIPVDDFQAASQLLASRTIAATANEDPALVTALFKSTPETICFTSILFLLGFIGDAWCRRLIADGLITEEQMRAIDTRRTETALGTPVVQLKDDGESRVLRTELPVTGDDPNLQAHGDACYGVGIYCACPGCAEDSVRASCADQLHDQMEATSVKDSRMICPVRHSEDAIIDDLPRQIRAITARRLTAWDGHDLRLIRVWRHYGETCPD